MITHPLLLAAVLLSVPWLVRRAGRAAPLGRLFRYLPEPFWCYFLPMAGATAGLFPQTSPLYGVISRYLLPVCLALLLVHVDPRVLARLGRPALVALSAGFAGIAGGAVAAFALFRRLLPEEAWGAVGSLAASWTGGSANMLAVKEAVGVPDAVFAPAVVVDTLLAYSWMAMLILGAGSQAALDRWNRADSSALDRAQAAPAARPAARPWPWPAGPLAALAVAGVSVYIGAKAGPALSALLARVWPGLAASISPATWAVLVVTTGALALAATGRVADEAGRSQRAGTFCLYVLLASLGARARLTALWEAPALLLWGLCCLAVHGVLLAGVGRLFRLPMFFLAAASQACVGGPVSAPIVAAVYRPALSAVGLLMAVAGNVVGTYVGVAVAHLCRLLA